MKNKELNYYDCWLILKNHPKWCSPETKVTKRKVKHAKPDGEDSATDDPKTTDSDEDFATSGNESGTIDLTSSCTGMW